MVEDVCEFCGFGGTRRQVARHRSPVHGIKLFRTYLATNGRCPMCERDFKGGLATYIGTYLDRGSCPDPRKDPRKWEAGPGERLKDML